MSELEIKIGTDSGDVSTAIAVSIGRGFCGVLHVPNSHAPTLVARLEGREEEEKLAEYEKYKAYFFGVARLPYDAHTWETTEYVERGEAVAERIKELGQEVTELRAENERLREALIEIRHMCSASPRTRPNEVESNNIYCIAHLALAPTPSKDQP